MWGVNDAQFQNDEMRNERVGGVCESTLEKLLALNRTSWVCRSSSLLFSSLDLSDTRVYEPYMRALLGTAKIFCEVVVLKLRTENLSAGTD